MTRDAAGEMSLAEHLTELRTRLLRAVIALVIGGVVGYIVFEQVFDFLLVPYCDIPSALRAIGPDAQPTCAVVALRPLEPFAVRMKVALLVGLLLGGPVIFYQLWRFITPGLTQRERRYALPFVVGSQAMFLIGGAFAFLVIPKGLPVLLGFGGPAITPQISAEAYLSFIITMILAFGIVFEVPLLITFLALVRIVSVKTLRRVRPYAIVGNFIVAALVTPTSDPVTLFALAVPMVLFYEASILAAWLIERRRRTTE